MIFICVQDSAFYLGGEGVEVVSGGLLETAPTPQGMEERCSALLAACNRLLPFTAIRHNIPILIGIVLIC
jgi:hypothetical protein